ncbi:MAG TPA: hypothetical protein VMF69_13335 [Gemmataceae bacterium]|nr:hypothetical protein [Gemmataceae bacterium]
MNATPWSWRDGPALAALLLVLIVCLPIFLCMPLWVDATFYDVCARVILHGGVLYRDTFDTNLPGMAWLHLGIRSLFGWRSEVLRAADFVVVAGIICLLARWDAALPRQGRIWTAAALLAYYFSTSEECQNQRDVWMLLPCLAALQLRRRQVLASPSTRGTLLLSGLEGLLWGAAVWIKPMTLVPALVCWLFSILLRYRAAFLWRPILLEGAGLLAGGFIVGSAGSLWLWYSGAWGPFWDILLNWDPEYTDSFMRWPNRWNNLRFWCVTNMPWCLVHMAALPLAAITAASIFRWRERPTSKRLAQNLLAVLYLSWIGQILLFQGWYCPHWTPPVLLGLALAATWMRMPAQPQWRVALRFHLLLFTALVLFKHPMLWSQRLATWRACVIQGSTNELRDLLALTPGQGVVGGSSDWEDLERIADFLRNQELREDEPICLHESTMPLYLELNKSPALRFLFYGQATRVYVAHRQQILAELSASRPRFVVSDLAMFGFMRSRLPNMDKAVPEPPPHFPKPLAELFPWSEPIVFRSGRYAVHRVGKPIGKFWP